MRFDGREAQAPQAAPDSTADVQSMSTAGIEGDEASKIAAMFQASSEQWDETQEKMAGATYRERPGMARRPPTARPPPTFAPTHDRPPPIGYICFRCGTKGHWIHDCPTNNDREFDNKPRFKRTTGIPKSMLKTVEAPTDGNRREGVMVTPDGSYVVAQVDSASWARNQAYRQKRLTKSDVYASVPDDATLACSLCSKLLRDAVRTPCCNALFCQECITNHLLEHDFQCPECEKRVKDLTELRRDDEARKQVREYVDAEMEKSERKMQEAEQAEKDEVEKAEREKAEREAEEKGDGAEGVKKEEAQGNDDGAEAKKEEDGQASSEPEAPDVTGVGNEADAGNAGASWNPQAVQQIMMMLCNPQLPPPMRMQLQMQLRFLQNQYMMMQQGQGRNGPATSDDRQRQMMQMQMQMQMQQQQQQQSMLLGAHNAMNPFAGQHNNSMGGSGMYGNALVGMRLAGNGGSGMGMGMGSGSGTGAFHPTPPLSHHESAYMRLPVNPAKRAGGGVGSGASGGSGGGAKRERPADFLELGGGGATSNNTPPPPAKEARTA